jgi:high-affinity iron transporter
MIASFFLSLREGLEAALLIGVLLGALNKLERPDYRSSIWLGAGLALIGSILVGIVLNLIGASFEGRAEEIFEGIAMLSAAAILTWAILWMQSQARAINQQLEGDVRKAVLKGSKTALLSLAFLAVIREGVELAFFLTAASIGSNGAQVLVGAGLGLAVAVILGVLLFKSLIRLNIGKFFQVTSIILILFAAGLVAHGVHEFNEAGLIPPIVEHVWDINPILDESSTVGELLKALFGYNGNPSLTEVLSYGFYFILLWVTSTALQRREQSLAAAAT